MKQYIYLMNNQISVFNICVGVGIIVFFIISDYYIKNEIHAKDYSIFVFWQVCVLIFGILGSIVLDNIVHRIALGKFRIGFTFYGALYGTIIGSILFALIYKDSPYKLLNCIAPGLAIGQCIGRIGCFFAGCCYGKPTTIRFGIVYPADSLPSMRYGQIPLFPTQIIESLLLLVVFLIVRKTKQSRFAVYLMLYGIGRFLIEYLRGDDRGVVSVPFSPSQIISIINILISLFLIINAKKRWLTTAST